MTAIQSAASNLAEHGHSYLTAFQKAMVAEIQEASERLDRFVGKVLDMTRLEAGCLKPEFKHYYAVTGDGGRSRDPEGTGSTQGDD